MDWVLKDKSLVKVVWVRREGGSMRICVREWCYLSKGGCISWGVIICSELKDNSDCVIKEKIGEI